MREGRANERTDTHTHTHARTRIRRLKWVQGKSIVNSISLKEGEEEFKRRAKRVW